MSFSGKRYLGWLRTIPSEMTLLSTVIALHTCYILSSVAFSLMALGSTTIRARVLRRTGALLRFLTMVRFLSPRPNPLATNARLGGAHNFKCSSSILRYLEIASKVLMCSPCVMNTLKLFQCSLSLGRALITFRTCSSLETSCLQP